MIGLLQFANKCKLGESSASAAEEEISEEFGEIHSWSRNCILGGANQFRLLFGLFVVGGIQVRCLLLQLVALALENVALLRLPQLLGEVHPLLNAAAFTIGDGQGLEVADDLLGPRGFRARVQSLHGKNEETW